MSNLTYPALCPDCLQPLTVSWPQQKHECKAVAVGPVLTCIPSEELDRLRAEVAAQNRELVEKQKYILHLEAEVTRIREAHVTTTQRARIAEAERDRHKHECAALTQQLADTQQKLADAEDEANTARVEAECLAASCKSATEQLAVANENVRLMAEQSLKYQEAAHAANGRVERMRTALEAIKEAVCGEYKGRWDTFERVYAIRGGIADACDLALSDIPEAAAAGLTQTPLE